MSGVLLPLLSQLPEVEPDAQPHLFCCENDHDAVMKLKTALNGRVFVIDCECHVALCHRERCWASSLHLGTLAAFSVLTRHSYI